VTVERVLVRKHPLREALADDDDRLRAVAVGVGEIASGDDGTPSALKNPGETVRKRARGSSSPLTFA
jgi:hypothetical protein